MFTRANESEYDLFSASLSRSPFSLFLGLDRLAAEQGPWRKRNGVYIHTTGREAEDEVKSDFPSVPSRYTRVPGQTLQQHTNVRLENRDSKLCLKIPVESKALIPLKGFRFSVKSLVSSLFQIFYYFRFYI